MAWRWGALSLTLTVTDDVLITPGIIRRRGFSVSKLLSGRFSKTTSSKPQLSDVRLRRLRSDNHCNFLKLTISSSLPPREEIRHYIIPVQPVERFVHPWCEKPGGAR